MALTRITQGVIKPNENYDTHDINSTGIITATGLNVSGNASIGGVLTYEDVTNIDSVGVITARAGVRVNADGSTSSNYISVGANDDLKIYHENNNSYIKNTGAGDLYIDDDGGGVSLLYSGSNRLYTDITGVGVLGNVDATGFLSGEDGIRLPLVGGVGITTIEKGQATFTGIVTASKFDGRLETLPNSNKTGAYVAVKEDSGTIITTTGNVTINQSIFSVGDIISVYNNSASNISIVQGTSVTLRLAGTATTGTRTLAQRGLMTVTCVASNEFVCSGGGLS